MSSELTASTPDELFSQQTDAAPVLIRLLAMDGTCYHCNAAWLEFTGRTRHEERGSGWTDGIHPEDQQRCLETWRAALATRREIRVEYRLRRHDGSYCRVQEYGTPHYLPDGTLTGYTAFGFSLSESSTEEEQPDSPAARRASVQQKQAGSRPRTSGERFPQEFHSSPDLPDLQRMNEATDPGVDARESQQLYAELVNSIDGIVWELALPEFRFTFVSQRAERILGFPVARWLSEPDFWITQLHPEDRTWAMEFCAQATREKRDHEFEYRMIAADGHIVWLHDLVTVVVENGEPVRLRGVMTDITGRREAEERLRRSEVRYHLIVDNLKDIVFQTDAAGRWTFLNPAWTEITGFTREESLGVCFLEFIHPDDRQRNQELFVPLLERKKDYCRHEIRHLAKGGGFRWIEVFARLMLDLEGNIIGTSGTLRDITEQKLAEAQLRESEERLRLAIDAANLGYWEWDIATGVIHWGGHHYGLFGLEPGTFSGSLESFLALVHPDDRELIRQTNAQMLAERGEHSTEYRIVRPDGTVRWMDSRGRLFCDETNQPVRLIGIVQDITDRKQAEEALRESQQRLELALTCADLGVWDLNLLTGEMTFSERLLVNLGYSPAEIRPHISEWEERLHPDDKPHALEILATHLRGDTPLYEAEYRLQTRNGEWKWMLTRAAVIERESDGQPLRMSGTLLDITARKNAEAERHQLQAQLFQAQKMESIGTLAGGIAHDFNNIMTAIIGNVHLMQLRLPADPRLREQLKDIEAAATRASSLTQQILSFSRRQRLVRSHLNLHTLITQLLEMLRRVIGVNIDITLRTEPALASIFADPSQIEQVLMNLLLNARDAMPGGGQISIVTSQVTVSHSFGEGDLEVRAGSYVRLTISDTGCGMTAETRQHVFEPFFTTKEVGRGTGLGLSVVYGIVRQHNGYIHLTSEPGQGTTFNLYFPASDGQAETPSDDTVAAIPNGHAETILVAEDEESLRKLTYEILTELGYKVLLARTGAEAVEICLARKSEIDLLLMDVLMPRMSGLEAYQAIRALGYGFPVIFMTGYMAEIAPGETEALNGAALIQKPYDLDQLSRQVRAALDQSPKQRNGKGGRW